MTDFDARLRARLERLDAAVPTPHAPTVTAGDRRPPLVAPTGVLRLPVRRRVAVLVAAAALVVALPLMALGGVFTSEDPFGQSTPEEFQAELDAAMAEVPLPVGRAWPDLPSLNTRQPDDCSDERPENCVGAYSRDGGRSTVELVAICIWLDEWVDATAAQDAARAAAAADEISRIPTWPSWNSVFFDQSVRDHLSPILDAVAEGQVAPPEAEVASGNCSWVNAGP